jgi:pimeloyl-ACP methyl ester carboxylesterase
VTTRGVAPATRRATIRGLGATLFASAQLFGCIAEAHPTAAKAKSGPKPSPNPRVSGQLWQTLPPTPVLPQASRSGLAAINGTRIFYAQFGAQSGDGPPVLLLHGGLGSSRYWGHQVNDLMATFSVTVMDTRGHGASPLLSSRFGYAVFAEDVVALLDFLKLESVALVGWSDGAVTGLQMAISYPARISRLFAFGANSSVSGSAPAEDSAGVFSHYVARCKAEYAQVSPTAEKWPQLVDGLRAMWRREPNFTTAQLQAIRTPTVIADGEHDEIIRREDTERMAKEIPGSRLVIEPGVSHFAMLQAPAQFSARLLQFLSGSPISLK